MLDTLAGYADWIFVGGIAMMVLATVIDAFMGKNK